MDSFREPVSTEDLIFEDSGDCDGGHIAGRLGFDPPGEIVFDGEDVAVALVGDGQGAHEVDGNPLPGVA